MAEDQLLEAQARPERERARAETADRPGCDLEHEWAAVVDAKLGVDRALGETQCRARVARHRGDAGLRRRRKAGRRDVDRLLEEWTVEGIGLVDDREHVEAAAHEQALEGELAPGDELLDEQRAARSLGRRRVRPPEDGRDALEGGDELAAIVRADHAPAR